MLTAREVSKHNTASSCWVIIDGYVYDVTQFLPDHPGGQQSVLRWAGKVRQCAVAESMCR